MYIERNIRRRIEKKKINIHVTKGTKRGDHFKIDGMSDYTPKTNRPGDLYIVFNELDNPDFKRQGNHLLYTKNILLSEALTGLEFILIHPSGESIIVRHHDIIKPNDIKVISGLGYPSNNSIIKGDLIIKFEIKFPNEIDEKRRDILRKILPKKSKIPFDKSLRECYLEPYDRNKSATYDDSDNDPIGEKQRRGSLPLVVIQKYEDLSREMLEREWNRIVKVPPDQWDWKRLTFQHWKERIGCGA